MKGLNRAQLQSMFGPLGKDNDVVDATLLHALTINVVDFVVTEDIGLHDRAKKHAPTLSNRVLYVGDAVLILRSTYEPIEVPIRYVQEVDAHTIPKDDPIFESLRDGYPEFDTWWEEKCIKLFRKCWVVTDGSELAGIVVRKDEARKDTQAKLSGEKILKVCTFKVRPQSRGIKLGELLLKKILWYAQANKYNVVYLTTFREQNFLIDLLEYYGFVNTYTAENGELTYEKSMTLTAVTVSSDVSIFDADRLNYPAFYVGPKVSLYGVPIKEAYHDELFPEIKNLSQADLFELVPGEGGPRRPGNTIRKVYICRAKVGSLQPGSILLFYKGSSATPPSQAITTVGIVEDMSLAESTTDLRRMTGGRSVYSERDLERIWGASNKPVKVINFLLAGHIIPPVGIKRLQQEKVFKGQPPQSIFRIPYEHLDMLIKDLKLGY